MCGKDDEYRNILRRVWGYDDFRGIQLDIIRSIGSGHDTLGLMPTGGGKSLTFQVPALAMEGLCLVVTPLIALMKDQVARLRSQGISAEAVYSGMTPTKIRDAFSNCILGGTKFLYLSPERLTTESFLEMVKKMEVSFIAVDEAHCISQWGYDFRPSYLCIAELREHLPKAPVLALTATATPRVADDICRRLDFRDGAQVFRMSFRRNNLSYIVRETENKDKELLHILNHTQGVAIVYTRSRAQTKDLTSLLEEHGIKAIFYHARLANVEKDEIQRLWQEGKKRVIVATNAFGMGIDKADVRLVVHYDPPDSPEAYFQESGRAGRDGKAAFAVLLYQRKDHNKLLRRIDDSFPPKEYIYKVYEDLCYYYEIAMGFGDGVRHEFNVMRFCQAFRHNETRLFGALKILTNAGYIYFEEEGFEDSRVMFTVLRDELYRINNLGQRAEAVIHALLRLYTGLFSEYAFIDEFEVARQSMLAPNVVYDTMIGLTHSRIIHYIPAKKVPRITFTQQRVEASEIRLPAAVYDDRRAELEERIQAMLAYAEESDECRTNKLLRYFGEKDTQTPCGHCDVCRSHRTTAASEAALRRLILARLSDGKAHPPNAFDDLCPGSPLFRRVMNKLTDEGFVEQNAQGALRAARQDG